MKTLLLFSVHKGYVLVKDGKKHLAGRQVVDRVYTYDI